MVGNKEMDVLQMEKDSKVEGRIRKTKGIESKNNLKAFVHLPNAYICMINIITMGFNMY